VIINQLSGGSKAHWLARSFSEAFLMRSPEGQAVEAVAPGKIVERLLNVLGQAVTSLSSQGDAPVLSTSSPQPAPRRFDFVHNAELRPILEQAYTDARTALDEGDYPAALRTTCGILEALVTDALEQKGVAALTGSGASSETRVVADVQAGSIADWSFVTRLTLAEKTGLIRGGWARLPDTARSYRDHPAGSPDPAISESDARRSLQVLHVIMRDLNPGR